MKKKTDVLFNIVLILILIAGVSLLLYPTFSDYWNSFRQTQFISNYTEVVENMDEAQFDEEWHAAEQFNMNLLNRFNMFLLEDGEKEEYNNLLNVTNNGLMAYVEIPKIDCILPIYHGTDEAILQEAIGHLDWSSLPVGGESTHCVISGHRGLPSARLFTDLDEMEIGDRFYLTVLGKKLAYEVDQILVVLPDDAEELMVKKGQDLVTMMTCTPYGVNTQRMFVRGHRIEYVQPDPEKETDENVGEEMEDVSVTITENLSRKFWFMAAIVFVALIVLFVFLTFVFGSKKPKKKIEKIKKEGKKKDEEESKI